MRALAELDASSIDTLSPVYETMPVGGPPQGLYLNAVVSLETGFSVDTLLARCLAIEQAMGRERRERWGPRIIDIDILLYGELVRDDAVLTIPHPRLTERAFVLHPLADIAGTLIHPVRKSTIASLRERVDGAGITRCPELTLATCFGQQAPENEDD